MKYLLYGIVDKTLAAPYLDGRVCLLAAHRLAAVVSPVDEINSSPSVSSLLAFERVVAGIHAQQAIIPLRYGCVMESESAVIRHLADHRQEYAALLERLVGMTEMGIRILWPERVKVIPQLPSSPGATYIASLRKVYKTADSLDAEESRLADQFTCLLSECCAEQRREASSSPQGRLVSLYFLTPANSIEQFRETARQIDTPARTKVLLSGPWPPFNFVVPAS